MKAELDTRQRLLVAAMHHYAESGFDRMSVRAITQDAGANLAAVNYYFGGKEPLLFAMFEDAIRPINEDRLRQLNEALELSGGEPLELEAIFDAFLLPMAEATERAEAGPAHFLRAMARLLSEGDEMMQRIDRECSGEIKRRFVLELERAAPQLPPEEVRWRMHFAVGSVVGTFLRHRMTAHACQLALPATTLRTVVLHLRDFICAGFRAPTPEKILPVPQAN
ncbi:MAG: TetR/AcrR family transcriptional regulator [Opitutales bacterium]